jgi:hypothetical protein
VESGTAYLTSIISPLGDPDEAPPSLLVSFTQGGLRELNLGTASAKCVPISLALGGGTTHLICTGG